MSSPETTSVLLSPLESPNGAVFSSITQAQALQILERNHGGLVAAMWAPVRNILEWLMQKWVNTEDVSKVIQARQKFNEAANDATYKWENMKEAA